jgi:uncharacterized YigZ family protein
MSERFTLAAPARLAQEIRKSKFVANAANAASEPVALDFLRAVSDRTATHNCWAWRIGQSYRFNDDGEPSGTAGKPILQAIDGQQLDGIVVVVTRWFGGIKLGAGGLVRAYGGCAAECLRTATKVPIVATARAQFTVEFAVLAVLRARLASLDAVVEAEDFTADGVNLRANFPVQRSDELRRLLADLTRGRAVLRLLE